MTDAATADAPIGVFDSGIGGVSVLRELQIAMPHEDFIYIADSAHCPYGGNSGEVVRACSEAMVAALEARGVKLITVACNTATVLAIDALRHTHRLPFVGMEPAVKPAAAMTRSGVVGVLSTTATASGARVHQLIDRYSHGARVLVQACPGLVERVECGDLHGSRTRVLVERYTAPLLAAGADTLVLGCTHYAFLRPLIGAAVGPAVRLVDTGAAVARRAHEVLGAGRLLAQRERAGTVQWLTTGDPAHMATVLGYLWASRLDLTTIENIPVQISETLEKPT